MYISDNVNNILKISKYDNDGDSMLEIDTQQEYKYLRDFLNGRNIHDDLGIFGRREYSYADLTLDDKKCNVPAE